MPFMDEMGSWGRQLRVYLFGRGLLSIAMLGATWLGGAMGWPLTLPALVIAAGGTSLSAFMRWNTQALYEEKMVDLYRDDIAQHLHIAPQEVGRAELRLAAQENEIIAQALTRQRRKTFVSIATSALASVVTLGLIYFALDPNAGGLTQNKVADALTSFFSHFDGVANLVKYVSIGIISGASGLVVHDGLEAAIGVGSGVSKAAAHDLIAAMQHDLTRGRSISATQVYAVLVAGDPALQRAIKTQFGHSYNHMADSERRPVLAKVGVTEEMQQLARAISSGAIQPGHLAYMIGETRGSSKQVAAAAPEASNEIALPQPAQAAFVEKLGLAPRGDASFAARVDASRSMPRERVV